MAKSLPVTRSRGVNIWDAATGKELHRLAVGRTSLSQAMDISPDGTTLAVGAESQDKPPTRLTNFMEISLWELKTGKKIRTFSLTHLPGNVFPLRFAPDGKSLALACDGKIVFFDLLSGEVINPPIPQDSPSKRSFYMLAFARGGTILAVGNSNTVQLWDMASKKWTRNIPLFDSPLTAMVFSPDGKLLAFGTEQRPNHIILADAETGTVLRQFGGEIGVNDLAFTPDGRTLLSGGWKGSGNIQLWDVATGELRRTLDGRISSGFSMAMSRDGKVVALGTRSQTIRLWNLATGAELFTELQGHDSQVNCLAFASDGKTLVSGADYEPIRLWDTSSWKQTSILKGSAQALSLSPDGKQVVTVKPGTSSTVQLWNAAGLLGPSDIPVPDSIEVLGAAFFGDGRSFFTLNRKSACQP